MPKAAIAYYSGYGHTARVAEEIKAGIEAHGVQADIYETKRLINQLDLLDDANTIVFGSPTYMGGPAAEFKQFADASSKKWFEQKWKNKLAAGFTNSGSLSGDKLASLQAFSILAAQHGMIWISTGMMPIQRDHGHGGKPEDINRVGSYLGLMTQSDHAEPSQTPSPGDVESAKLFGQRIAEVTKRWESY